MARPHGVAGIVRVIIDDPTLLPTGTPLRLVRGTQVLETRLMSCRPQMQGALCAFAGIDSREAARQWTGAAVQICHQDLQPAPPGEFYLHELLGNLVVDQDGICCGTVARLETNGAQPLLVIQPPQGAPERLLPVVPALVIKREPARCILHVRVPQGLWD